jgi:osmoprotectant transport system ATP-binding protein
MIAFESISKSYDGVSNALDNFSLEIIEGEILVLLGSSGSGKSTALRMINRLVEPTAGKILFNGEDIKNIDPIALRRSIGYVVQGVGLLPHMTVEENITIVPRLLNWSQEKLESRCEELLELVRLPSNSKKKFPDELSGGQQQRVGVARALAADPSYLLMDEPFGALDAITRDILQREFLELKRRLGKTVVFVTHDIVEALVLSDRIAVLHDGRLEQIGTKNDLFENPKTDFVENLFAKTAQQLSVFKDFL